MAEVRGEIGGVNVSITIRRPIGIKIVLTEDSKRSIIEEIRQMISQVSMELEQLEFQLRRSANEAESSEPGTEAASLRAQLENERSQRTERREQLLAQLQQIQQLPVGFELPQGNVDSSVDVNVGDSWDAITKGVEIIIRDGKVAEIRDLSQSQ